MGASEPTDKEIDRLAFVLFPADVKPLMNQRPEATHRCLNEELKSKSKSTDDFV